MSESTRLGFCTDNIAGILTLDSTIQSSTGIKDGIFNSLNVNNAFTVDSDGNTFIGGTLEVIKPTVLGTLTVLGSETVYENLDVSGSARIGQNLDVSGYAHVGTLDVSGSALIHKNLVVKKNVDIDGSIDVSGNAIVHKSLYVEYNAGVLGELDVLGNAFFGTDVIVERNVSVSSDLDVSGSAQITRMLVLEDLTVGASATVNTDLTVVGSGTFGNIITGGASVNAGLTVGGTGVITNLVSGPATADSLIVVKNTGLWGNLDVSGSTNLRGTLDVFGPFIMNGPLNMNGPIIAGSTFNVVGAATFDSTVNVLGVSTLDTLSVTNQSDLNDVSVTGFLTANNATVVGPTNLNTLTVNGLSTFQDVSILGSASFSNLAISGPTNFDTLSVKDITSTGTATLSDVTVSGSAIMQNGLQVTGQLSADNLLLSTFSISGTSNLNDVNITNLAVSGTTNISSLSAGVSSMSSLDVLGNVYISGTLTGPNVGINPTLTLTSLDLSGDLAVGGISNLKSVTASALNVFGNTVVGGFNSLNGNLVVTTGPDLVTIKNQLTVNGILNLSAFNGTGGILYAVNQYISGQSYFSGVINTTGINGSGGNFVVDSAGNTSINGTLTINGVPYSGGSGSSSGLMPDIYGYIDVSGLRIINAPFRIDSSGVLTVSSLNQLMVGGQPLSYYISPATVNSDISGDLTVAGISRLNGGLDVSGKFLVDTAGNLDLSGSIYLRGSNGVYVNGVPLSTSIFDTSGNFTVPGRSYLRGGLDVSGKFLVDTAGNLDLSGSIYLRGSNGVYVNGVPLSTSIFDTSGNFTVPGRSYLRGGLDVSGKFLVDTAGNLDLSGSIYLRGSNGVYVNGVPLSTSIFDTSGNFTVPGRSYLRGGVDVSGLLLIDSSGVLSVQNPSQILIGTRPITYYFQTATISNYDVSGDLRVGGNIDTSGSIYLRGTNSIYVNGLPFTTGLKPDSYGYIDVSGLRIINAPFRIDSSGVLTVSSLNQLMIGAQPLSYYINTATISNYDISGNLTVAGATSLKILDVSGATSLKSLVVSGITNLNILNINGIIQQNGYYFSLDAFGNLVLSGGAFSSTSGISNFNSINVNNNCTVSSTGKTSIKGAVDISNSLIVTGATSLNTIDVSGKTSIKGPVDISNSLIVTGATNLNGLDISSRFRVYPTGQIQSLDVSSNIILGRNTLTTIGTDTSASLLINGIAITGSSFNGTVNGPLTVTGLSTLNSINVGGSSQNPNCNINNAGVLTIKGINIPPNSTPGTINVNSGKFTVNSNGTLQLLNTAGTPGLIYDGLGATIYDSLTLGTANKPAPFTVNGPSNRTVISVTDQIFNINRPTVTRMTCVGDGSTAVQIEPTTGTSPYLTVGNITSLNLPNLANYATVIRGDVYISGTLTSTGVSSSNPSWSDISAAVAVQFSGANSVSYLDVSAGITAGTAIQGLGSTNTLRANYNNFNGNYLSDNATSAEIIRALNMVISQQNRIIAALLNKRTTGP